MTLAMAFRDARAPLLFVALFALALGCGTASLVAGAKGRKTRQWQQGWAAAILLIVSLVATVCLVRSQQHDADAAAAARAAAAAQRSEERCRAELARRDGYFYATANAYLALWFAPAGLLFAMTALARVRTGKPFARGIIGCASCAAFLYVWRVYAEPLPGAEVSEELCNADATRDDIRSGDPQKQWRACFDLDVACDPGQHGTLPKVPTLERLLPDLRALRDECIEFAFSTMRTGNVSGLDALEYADSPIVPGDEREAVERRAGEYDALHADARCGGRAHRSCLGSAAPASVDGVSPRAAIRIRESIRGLFPLLAFCDIQALGPFRFTIVGVLRGEGPVDAASITDVQGLDAGAADALRVCARRALDVWEVRGVNALVPIRYTIEGRPAEGASLK